MGHSVWTFDDLNPFYDPAIKQRALATLNLSANRSPSSTAT